MAAGFPPLLLAVRQREAVVRRDLSNIHFEGATIVRVIEDTDRHMLTFEVSYAIPEGSSDFPRRELIFQHFSRYFVDEGRSGTWSEPTIERVEITHTEPD